MTTTNQYRSAKELLTALVKIAASPSKKIPLPNVTQPFSSMSGIQSLGENISPYYQFLTNGLETAVGNSQSAWDATKKKHRMTNKDDMEGMFRKIPVLSSEGKAKRNYYDVVLGSVYLDPKGSNKPVSLQHELTHSLHLRPNYPGATSKNKYINALQRWLSESDALKTHKKDFTENKAEVDEEAIPFSDKYLKYISQKGEIAVRLAEVRRRYAYTHPGEDVTNPEQADKALDWFLNANPMDYEKGLIKLDTQMALRYLRRDMKDKEYLRSMMPTTAKINSGRKYTYAA